ncbi:MAG TPA: spore coat U domain-containing protein [Rhizomicrobium sp.]|nr:spore coat U domain-containing protein [Rhizomicrobium sp.]
MRIRSLAVFFLLAPSPALALCTSIGVSATPVDFGVYDPASSAAAGATGTITVQCGIGILPVFTVSLSKGSGSFAQRTLQQGSDTLNYNLYADALHMTVWGDGSGGSVTQGWAGLLTLGSTDYTVYGLVTSGQYPAPGSYTDSIVVTVKF